MQPKPLPTLPLGYGLSGGRYKIVRKLGEGGYGSVYLAQDTRLGKRQVAIKELHEPSPEAQQLFSHEAALLSSLNHPGLVRVSDFFGEGRSHYLVMDYIEGRDLLDLALEADQARHLLPADKVAEWILQVCEAVAYLHGQKPPIIHRDIKPGNIRLSKDERAMLVDFGIAKVDPRAKTQLIAKAVSIGFSPPEQYAGGGGTDTRSDVYALGATLYCLLTVTPPPDSFERLTRDAPLIPPRRINLAISQELEEVVVKAMSLNSLQRYQDAGEMLAALQAAMGRRVAPPPGIPSVVRPAGVTCSYCSHPVRRNSRFCPRCGTRLGGTQRCPSCGATCRPGARFCSRCRTSLSAAPVAPQRDLRRASQHLAQGDTYAKASQFAQAASEYERAMALGADDTRVYVSLGRCYIQLDRLDDAITLLENGARKYAKDAAVHTQLAMAYLGAGKFSQGLQTLELAYQLAPDNDDLALLLVGIYFDAGRQAKATPILERILRRRPRDPNLRARLAVCYLMADRLGEAERLVKDLQRESPSQAELSFLMGMINLKKGKSKEALKDFQKAIRQDPRHALAHYFMGEVYFDQKKWKDALAAYQRCADANPRDADPQARMCLCYLALHKPAEALAALQRALQIDPQNQMANQIAAELVK